MLALERLTIEDFGPYRGRQTIEFTRDRGVYIVYGPNGRGKTTLHNAFRYALYGEILGRRRAEHARELVNSEARKQAGYGSFETTLDFRHQGSAYRLTRRYDEREQPHELCLLERDGIPLSQDETEKALQIIAPVSVSQFFLFDGELLRRYEALLDKDSEEGEALEESIERVLGIPVVSNAMTDVGEISRLASRQLADQYAAHGETQRLALAQREAAEIRDRLQDDVDGIKRNVDEANARVEELDALLREQQKSARMLGQLDQLRAQQSTLADQERTAIEALGQLSGSLWKAVLASSANDRLQVTEQELALTEAELQAATAAVRDLAHLREAPDCPVCHQDVPLSLRHELIADLDRSSSAAHREALQGLVDAARIRRKTLLAVGEADGLLLAERDRQLRNIRLQQQSVQDDISEVEKEISEIGEESLRAWTTERDERKAQIQRDKDRIEAALKSLRDQESAVEDLKRRLRANKLIQPDPTIELKDRVATALKGLFQDSIDAYRKKLRTRVEERASEVFREISSEQEYARLRITDGYGLEILDENGEVMRRSAGYEHLVALSLISALQDSAAVRGPVIMDYPFGRLDAENTARVVAALPRMARQVVLLSFDGEFDRPTALKALGANLVAEYELERVTLKHTQIKPRGTI